MNIPLFVLVNMHIILTKMSLYVPISSKLSNEKVVKAIGNELLKRTEL